jgi:hypothetical protein
MTTMYSDRVLVTFNGVNIFPPGDMASFSTTLNANLRAVEGMTTTGNVPGFVKGNNEIVLNFTQFVQNNASQAPIDFSQYDYESNNVQITIASSSKSYGEHIYQGPTAVFSGVVLGDDSWTGSGPGNSMTKTYVFRAQTRVLV